MFHKRRDDREVTIKDVSRRYLRVVENTSPVVGADHSVFPILAEVGGGDETRLTVHLVPERHLFVRNVPQP